MRDRGYGSRKHPGTLLTAIINKVLEFFESSTRGADTGAVLGVAVSAALSFFFLLFGHCEAKYSLEQQYKHKLLLNLYFSCVSVRGAHFFEVVLLARERSMGTDAVPDIVHAGEGWEVFVLVVAVAGFLECKRWARLSSLIQSFTNSSKLSGGAAW